MKPELTMSERANYLKMALALTGITADERGCDMLLRVLDRFEKLGGDFSVHDAVAIQHENRRLFEGQARFEETENIRTSCSCGKNQQTEELHSCPARPDEITTCKCCNECQTKCAESQR
jgi:hypothetical protein